MKNDATQINPKRAKIKLLLVKKITLISELIDANDRF